MKVLICITPQGTISFVSKDWCGQVSDKCIIEQSVEKFFEPGDIILVDRGFTIEEYVNLY